MGVSDKKIIPEQEKIIKEFFGDFVVKKIAFLGTNQAHLKKIHPNTVENFSFELFKPERIDYFDIRDNNWDINESWDEINGYDLVVAFRVTSYATSIKHFFEEIKKLVRNNKHVLIDFTIYSGSIKYRNKKYIKIGKKSPRTAPLRDKSISFDFREELSFWQKIKAFILLHYGLNYFSGEIINSFSRKEFERHGIKILKTKYAYQTIKKDLDCYLYLQSD